MHYSAVARLCALAMQYDVVAREGGVGTQRPQRSYENEQIDIESLYNSA